MLIPSRSKKAVLGCKHTILRNTSCWGWGRGGTCRARSRGSLVAPDTDGTALIFSYAIWNKTETDSICSVPFHPKIHEQIRSILNLVHARERRKNTGNKGCTFLLVLALSLPNPLNPQLQGVRGLKSTMFPLSDIPTNENPLTSHVCYPHYSMK